MKFLAFALSAYLLVGCGGGGSATPEAQAVNPNLFVTGTSAIGKAIAGATVNAKCRVGTGNATTLADGTYRLVIPNGSLPCLPQVTDPADQSKLHSFAAGTGATAWANITPLSEMLTARILGKEPSAFFDDFDGELADRTFTADKIQVAKNDVELALSGVVNTNSISDFISAPFKAATQDNPDGGDLYDKKLDELGAKLNHAQRSQVVTALANTANINDVLQLVTTITAVPPTARAGAAQNIVVGTIVTLDGSTSSADASQMLTYAWTLTARPAGSAAALSAPTSAQPTFNADVAGTYVATLIVNDGKVSSGAATVSVTATVANAAPVANAGVNQNVVTGIAVKLNGSASSDANGDALTYAWTLTARPAGSAAALSAPTSAQPTFNADVAGTYVATLIVNDGKVSSGAATVSVTAAHAIAAWGDSLTLGYSSELRKLLPTRTIFNGGVGGQSSTQIAGRQGGVVPLWTVANNTIPASGGVVVTAQSSTLHVRPDGIATGALADVHGTLTLNLDSASKLITYTFTRSNAGEPTHCEPATPFIVDVFDRNSWINTFWYGRNNYGDAIRVKADIAASIAFLAPGNEKFVVLSILNGSFGGETIGGSGYNKMTQLNNDLAALYPQNYIDIRAFLVSQYDPTIPQDVIDFQNDVVPSSLRTDAIHLTTKGSALVAKKVQEFIQAKGW